MGMRRYGKGKGVHGNKGPVGTQGEGAQGNKGAGLRPSDAIGTARDEVGGGDHDDELLEQPLQHGVLEGVDAGRVPILEEGADLHHPEEPQQPHLRVGEGGGGNQRTVPCGGGPPRRTSRRLRTSTAVCPASPVPARSCHGKMATESSQNQKRR